MKEILKANTWLERTFLGDLYVTGPTGLSPVAIKNDYLIVEPSGRPIQLRFQFQTETQDRLHFIIQQTTPGQKRFLNTSNGFLLLLPPPAPDEIWKLEPLEANQREVRCRIRDHRGYQVKTDADGYLRTENGELREFILKRFSPLF